MKRIISLLALLCLEKAVHAQYIYTIKADSVKITNSCDTAELIIENHTQNVCGFLFNKGRGRTEFRRGLIRINDSTSIIGCDTLKMNPWLQGGNRFGTIGKFGTLDDNPIDYYTNNTLRGRWATNGNFIIGSSIDEGRKFQVKGTAGVFIDPNLSREGDRIMIGGYNNLGDGQNIIFRTSSDYGATYHNILTERDGGVGLGINGPYVRNGGKPTILSLADGQLSIMTWKLNFGNIVGPVNSSALEISVPVNEWLIDSLYPSGQNSYYIGTRLTGTDNGQKRAPLRLSGRELRFQIGAFDTTAMKILESGSVMMGPGTDNGDKLQVIGNLFANANVRFSGLTNDNELTRVVVSDANGNLYYRTASSLALNETMNSDLAVNGRISAQKMLITQTGRWPDYVFSKHYKLPTLTEVETFINQNSHLSGIPSAAEIEKNGIDVANNQAALLKKIEELTLYIIEQDKTIKKQNDQYNELKHELAELKALIKANSIIRN